jgi:hypothetical protein
MQPGIIWLQRWFAYTAIKIACHQLIHMQPRIKITSQKTLLLEIYKYGVRIHRTYFLMRKTQD